MSGSATEGAIWGICTESHGTGWGVPVCAVASIGMCELNMRSTEAGQLEDAHP